MSELIGRIHTLTVTSCVLPAYEDDRRGLELCPGGDYTQLNRKGVRELHDMLGDWLRGKPRRDAETIDVGDIGVQSHLELRWPLTADLSLSYVGHPVYEDLGQIEDDCIEEGPEFLATRNHPFRHVGSLAIVSGAYARRFEIPNVTQLIERLKDIRVFVMAANAARRKHDEALAEAYLAKEVEVDE